MPNLRNGSKGRIQTRALSIVSPAFYRRATVLQLVSADSHFIEIVESELREVSRRYLKRLHKASVLGLTLKVSLSFNATKRDTRSEQLSVTGGDFIVMICIYSDMHKNKQLRTPS